MPFGSHPKPLSRTRERGALLHQDAALPRSRTQERGAGGEGIKESVLLMSECVQGHRLYHSKPARC